MEEALTVLDSCLIQTKWRLKSHAKRRLQIDILALCTCMRPVIMVDYGGKMPELQQHLIMLLKLCQQESATFEHLRVMVVEDMIYLVHTRELAEFVKSSLDSQLELAFVNLEQDPPKMVTQEEENSLVAELVTVQKLFSSVFSPDGMSGDLLPSVGANSVAQVEASIYKPSASQSSDFIDLSCCIQDTSVTVPTLNGWLLGYPVVYLFSKDHIADAIYNLSIKYLRIFKVTICRNVAVNRGSQPEELMSFSVPYELSMGGSNEPWAKTFMAQMHSRWERCKQTWSSLQLEVDECYPQVIAF